MYAIHYTRQKFFTEEMAISALQRMEEDDRQYGSKHFNRRLVGTEIISCYYSEVHPFQLDDMFHQQVNSVDHKLATGAAKRTSHHGYDPSLMEEDDDE